MSLKVYTVELIAIPINHIGIFVETDASTGAGQFFNVEGNILTGMTYISKPIPKPDTTPEFLRETFIGTVAADDLHTLEKVCLEVEVPGKQLKLDGTPIDKNKPPRRCTEWTKEAVDLLLSKGVVRSGEPHAS